MTVQYKSGERLIGPLTYTPEHGEGVTRSGAEPSRVDMGQVTAIYPSDEESPEVVALKTKLNAKVWSFHVDLGILGQTGNSEIFGINGHAEAKYKTDVDTLRFYSLGRFSHENGKDTSRDVIGGIDFEHRFTKRFFAFGHGELENDPFQDLSLRAFVTGGLGYYVIKEPNIEWKVRGGPGYEHDSYYGDTPDKDSAIMELGEFLDWKIVPWLHFVHDIDYFPTFNSLNDYRVVMENAIEVPISKDEAWKLKLGVRNQYVSEPADDTDRLDTWYFLNLGMDF